MRDTAISLTSEDAKIINVVFNEYNRYRILNIEKDTLLELKEKKIAHLTAIENMRSEQVVLANTEIHNLKSTQKSLKKEVIFWKIATGLAIITTYLLVK